MDNRIGYYNKKGISIFNMPLYSLNKVLFLSGLAFITGILLTIGVHH